MCSKYTSYTTTVLDNGDIHVDETVQFISVKPIESEKLGVMLIGLGGNNGTTFVAGLRAYQKGLTWETKSGEHKVQFLGSISQVGSVYIGRTSKGVPHSRLFKDVSEMYDPNDIIVGGWDINADDLYTAAKKAQVIEPALLGQLEEELSVMVPLPSVFSKDFIASNQELRANNVLYYPSHKDKLERIKEDIRNFKQIHKLKKVILLWTASTERFHRGAWKNANGLLNSIRYNDPEVSPSVLFAVAAIESDCIFLNGSPQNTIGPGIIDLAAMHKTFVGGEDFKTGQTKLKSALVDWLVSSGIRPLSIVSYNHLGNNDGKNLSETPQFHSKELSKKNVIDDVVEINPILFPDGKPDHTVVIKYVPAVRDSKRAMDEYYSQLFLDGRHTLSLHNICEDSLLAVPLMLDIVLFADLFSRVRVSVSSISGDSKVDCESRSLSTVLSPLSFFFKAPVANDGEAIVNAFFKQRHGLENFFRLLLNLPPLDHISLPISI